MSAAVVVDVLVDSPVWEALPEAEELVTQAIEAAAGLADRPLRPGAEVSVLLADDAMVRGLNRQWRGKDSATNVLSFPAAAPGETARAPLLGDIALAYETIRREAGDEARPIADHLRHLAVHGFLHLIGHDHLTNAQAEAMEALERRILASLGVPDPYADTGAAPL